MKDVRGAVVFSPIPTPVWITYLIPCAAALTSKYKNSSWYQKYYSFYISMSMIQVKDQYSIWTERCHLHVYDGQTREIQVRIQYLWEPDCYMLVHFLSGIYGCLSVFISTHRKLSGISAATSNSPYIYGNGKNARISTKRARDSPYNSYWFHKDLHTFHDSDSYR